MTYSSFIINNKLENSYKKLLLSVLLNINYFGEKEKKLFSNFFQDKQSGIEPDLKVLSVP